MRILSIPTLLLLLSLSAGASELTSVGRYGVAELSFTGPSLSAADDPVRSVDFWVDFRHESGSPTLRVHGFWDADGSGGSSGGIWRVRFCPSKTGRWTLLTVASNRSELAGEKQGDYVTATSSSAHGFWEVDTASAGGRWFKRSDGSHQYLVGNTFYDFLSRPDGNEASASSIRSDIAACASYFKKVRFCLFSFRGENASSSLQPFLNASGQTNSETHVPNPRFFRERVDAAVQEGLARDLVCDLIMAGTAGDQYANQDGFIKYVAARYGAYPNVWFTIGQEWNEQTTAANQKTIGGKLRSWLAYPSPVSTHATGAWDSGLTGSWHSHSIRQQKVSDLSDAADGIGSDYARNGGKPMVNDENGYDPGEASSDDVIEGITGTFAGGGYGTTGNKTASKQGGYVWGHAARGRTISDHPSIASLKFLRQSIDQHISFWKLLPKGNPSNSIFAGANSGFRVLEWSGNQYVLASDAAGSGITAKLPAGQWNVLQLDVRNRSQRTLSSSASGAFSFSTPASRAALTVFTKTGDGGSVNQPPVADAGPDQSVGDVDGDGVQAVTLNGSGSSDPDGSIASYVWRKGGVQLASGQRPSVTLAVGSHSLVLEVTDAAGASDSDSVSIVVTAPQDSQPTITTTSSELANATVGSAYSDDVEAVGGDAPLAWSISAGALPPGLALSGSEITGTPTQAGSFGFTLRVSDVDGDSDSQALTISVSEDPNGGGDPLVSGLVVASGKAYQLATMVEGAKVFIDRSYTAYQVPASLDGQLFIRTANDDKRVSSKPMISFDLHAAADVYVALDQRATDLGSWLGDWTLQSAKLGSTDVDRRLYVKRFAAGRVELGPNDASGVGSMYFVLIVPSTATPPQPDSQPTISTRSSDLAHGTVGTAYSERVEAVGGDTPLVWSISAGALPPGLTLSGATIAGTPSQAGSFDFTLRVSDADGDSVTQALRIVIDPLVEPEPPAAIAINFQPASAPIPGGWLADGSATFGLRRGGLRFGWTSSFDQTRDRNAASAPDQVHDTLNHLQKGGVNRVWELELPAGSYEVTILRGDPSFTDQDNDLLVEGVLMADVDGQGDHFDLDTLVVEVSDGRLTLRPASTARNAKICSIEIRRVDVAVSDG